MDGELHLTKKDFKVEWFSGQGAGGQHRNKHQNCCRIIHIESGLTSQGTESRKRVVNQRVAFTNLAEKVISYYFPKDKKVRTKAKDVIRTYNAVDNKVYDKSSGYTSTYKHVVLDANLDKMIENRHKHVCDDYDD